MVSEWEIMYSQAQSVLWQGEVSYALRLLQRAHDIARCEYGEESLPVMVCLEMMAKVCAETHKIEQAIEFLTTVLTIKSNLFGDDHCSVAVTCEQLADLWAKHTPQNPNNDMALSYYEKALEIKTRVYGLVHPEVADIWYRMGLYMGTCGDYNYSIYALRKAFDIRRVLYGAKHPIVEATLNMIEIVAQYVKT